mmetsp:Transcript_47924/g.77323  ORF Transcript_47924/g.77323 Transcript_47924/m.77323 type:complete len:106 (+) Transcript_47924:2-319(+)
MKEAPRQRFLFLTIECRGLKAENYQDAYGTLMAFVVVEVYSDRHKWQFAGHSEVSDAGASNPKFQQTVKVSIYEHLKGNVPYTSFRFSVFSSTMNKLQVERVRVS